MESKKKNKTDQSVFQNLQTKITTEIEKAQDKKSCEFNKVENEVLQLHALIEKHRTVILEEIEIFYDNRLKLLDNFLGNSRTFQSESQPDPRTSFGAIQKRHQENMIKESLKFLENELCDQAEFCKSSLNDQIIIGSVSLPKTIADKKFEFSYKVVEKVTDTNFIELTVFSSTRNFLGILTTQNIPDAEIWDLTHHRKLREIDDLDEVAIQLNNNELFDNIVSSQMAVESNTLVDSGKVIYFRGKRLHFKRQDCICTDDYVFWAEYNQNKGDESTYRTLCSKMEAQCSFDDKVNNLLYFV